MELKSVDVVDNISPEAFRKKYYEPQLPVVLPNLAKNGLPTINGIGIT